MPIVTSDLEMYTSSATDSTGGTITGTAITDNVLNNLFDDITAGEAETGQTDYRKVFAKNNHGSLSWLAVQFWRSVNTTSADDEISLGIGTSDDDDGSNVLSAMTGNARIALISDGADTRPVTLVGEDVSGNRQTESVTLTNGVEVLSVGTYSKLYLASVASTSASRIVTVKQGSGGSTRGTIGLNKYSAILYLNPTSATDAFELGNIAAGASQGLWLKRVVNLGAGRQSANTGTIKVQGSTS